MDLEDRHREVWRGLIDRVRALAEPVAVTGRDLLSDPAVIELLVGASPVDLQSFIMEFSRKTGVQQEQLQEFVNRCRDVGRSAQPHDRAFISWQRGVG